MRADETHADETGSAAESLKSEVQERFGGAAANYAVSRVHSTGPDLVWALDRAGLAGDERILDIGCGAGHTALAFAERAPRGRVDALDLTEPMLEQVARLAGERGIAHLYPRRGEAESLPYPDAHFDLATCRLCAHHFHDPERAVAEAFRVLRPGGSLFWIDIVAPEEPALDTFLNLIEWLRDPSHARDQPPSQWRRMLAAAGFALEAEASWSMEQDFRDWVARIGTEPANVGALETVFAGASASARGVLEVGAPEGDSFRFCLRNHAFHARRPT